MTTKWTWKWIVREWEKERAQTQINGSNERKMNDEQKLGNWKEMMESTRWIFTWEGGLKNEYA